MIDITEPVVTRDGRSVRKLSKGKGVYPISGEVRLDWGWEHAVWTGNGEFCIGDENPNTLDLVQEFKICSTYLNPYAQ